MLCHKEQPTYYLGCIYTFMYAILCYKIWHDMPKMDKHFATLSTIFLFEQVKLLIG